jgi:hypothetical protein
VAQAQQHDGGDHIHRIGDGGGAARGDAGGCGRVVTGLQGVFEQVVGQHADQGWLRCSFGGPAPRWCGRAGGAFGHQAFVGQALAQGLGQVLGVQAGVWRRAASSGAQAGAGALHKALHVGCCPGRLAVFAIRAALRRADAALGKHGAVGLGFFSASVHWACRGASRARLFKVEARWAWALLRLSRFDQRGLDQGLVDALLVFGHGHQHAQLFEWPRPCRMTLSTKPSTGLSCP